MGVSLVLLAVVLVVVGVVAARILRTEGRAPASGAHGVRRFFQYVLLYGLLWVAGIGLAGLLARLLDVDRTAGDDPAALAVSTAFAVVGVPLFTLLAAWTRRGFRADPREARSRAWRLYIAAATLTTLGMAMSGAHGVLSWATGLRGYDAAAVAGLVVWGLLWFGHWSVDRRVTPATEFTLHRLLGSVAGLVTSAVGAVALLGDVVGVLLRLEPESVFAGGEHLLLPGAVALAVGAPVWLVYWVVAAGHYVRDRMWLAYVLLAGVAGGLVTAIASASLALYDVLVWLLGEPSSTDAGRHFARVPDLAGALVVGLVVWWYHRVVLREGGTGERTEVRRVYEYLVAGIGLVAAACGLAMMVVALLQALAGSPELLVGGTQALNAVLAAATLLAVGAPLWSVFWRRIGAAARVDPEEEHASPTRRIYVLVLFGVAGVAAVVALLVGVVLVLQDVFAGTVSAETLRGASFPVGIIAAAGAVSGYHWSVYRDDRSYLRAGRHGPRYVLLVGPGDPDVARALARRTGGRVEVWARADGLGRPWSVDDLASMLAGRDDEEVVVVAGPDCATVVPVQRG